MTDAIRVTGTGVLRNNQRQDKCPTPGFPTDLQPQITTLLTPCQRYLDCHRGYL